MKLFRGDWSFVVTYNLILLFLVITTGTSELLYLLLGNVALIAIQLYLQYNKAKELYYNETQKQEYNDILLPKIDEEKLKKHINDRMYERLTEDKKKRWLILQYISYCVITRKLQILNNNENDLKDVENFISINYEKIYLLNENQKDYLLNLSEKWKNPRYNYIRYLYYQRKIKETLTEMDRDNIFKNNHDFFFNFEKDSDNEISKYIQTGNYGNFSNYFKNKINELLQADINLYEYYFDVMEMICDELWYEFYEKNDIKDI